MTTFPMRTRATARGAAAGAAAVAASLLVSTPALADDVAPGGAVDPSPTPVMAAAGEGDVAALTFDDGPNGQDTEDVLDFLAVHEIPAVFCVIGQNIEAEGGAELLERIVADGHTLCNHSTGYADMGSWTTEQVRADLEENLRIIRDALGDPDAPVPFFRAPNGSWGATPEVAVELGMQPLAVVNTISDWATQDEAVLTENLRAAFTPGELVLLHDGGGDRAGTVAAMRTVVTEKLDEGWTFSLPVVRVAGEDRPASLEAPAGARTGERVEAKVVAEPGAEVELRIGRGSGRAGEIVAAGVAGADGEVALAFDAPALPGSWRLAASADGAVVAEGRIRLRR